MGSGAKNNKEKKVGFSKKPQLVANQSSVNEEADSDDETDPFADAGRK